MEQKRNTRTAARRPAQRRPAQRTPQRRPQTKARRGKPVRRATAIRIRLPKWPLGEVLAVVFSVLLPPVGILLTWLKTGWSARVRYAMTAFAAVVLVVMVALMPTKAAERKTGGVTIIGTEKSAEVYGPEMPEATVVGYTDSTVESVLADDSAEDAVTYVFAADGAKCYHLSDCKFAFASAHRLTVYEATYLGFKPCGRCKPPVFSGNAGSAN